MHFDIQEDPDCHFKRVGNDLVYTHTLSLEDALKSAPMQIKTLDFRNLNLVIDEMITPQLTRTIKGEGMPLRENPEKKGDMHIKFNVVFPKVLKSEYRQQILKVFSQ